jgi:PAS domain S-box-containing protein
MTARKLARAVADGAPAQAAGEAAAPATTRALSHEQPGNLAEAALSDLDLGRWAAELLDPESWGEILSRYGRTMKLAVALTDIHGNLLGPCHNPQPVWVLARRRKPESDAAGSSGSESSGSESRRACPFCLAPHSSCNAAADALATGEIVFVHDQADLTHAAIPLFLGNQRLGTLIAGQVFAQYPQPLALKRVAKYFGASPQDLWHAAVHQVPISRATLRLYADLLASLGQAFLRQRYAAILDRSLHQMDERYRMMIEGSKDHALFTVDGGGCVTSWNPGAERLLGYTEAEIGGKDYSAFFTPEDIQGGLPGRGLQLVEQNGWIEEEGWQVRKDGSRFLSETVTARLGGMGERDSPEYGRLLHNVTEERKSAESVLQAQKLESIGVLAGGIAHDFNNLLTSILGNVSLAMVGLPEDDPTRPLLDIAERSSVKAAALIAQLLAYAGKGDSTVTRFDVSGLIAEILPLIETSIPKAVQLNLSLPEGLPWILADASEIQQIVMNLVINGAEAIGPEGGSLWVSTGESQPDGVYFEVKDSGCGMDEVTQRRIFEPFFTTKFTGRGLGLAAVSGIVRRLKGRLELESAPGEGSTFRIVFPGVPAQLPQPKINMKGDLHGSGVILVVDDDRMVRNLAHAVLERYGYSVLTAENGKAAVHLFRTNAETITAVLLDLTMPVMGGGEAFRLMKEIRPEIPIIISSGYGESAIREQFTSALAGVIRKPYTVSELREKIAAVLTIKKSAGA